MWPYWILAQMTVIKLATSQGSVRNIQVQNNVYPVEGNSVVIICTITGFSTSVFVYRGNSTDIGNDVNVAVGTNFLESCISNSCLKNGATILGRYTITADSSSVSISIRAASKSEDQKYWTCKLKNQDSKQQMFLKFPTVPAGLNISPNQDLDLSIQSVNVTCGTSNCVSPEPTFSWYISEDGQSAQRYTISETKGNTGTKCPDIELMYTSTFTLRQYTTSSDNQDKTVKFQCRIDSFPGVTSTLTSSWSGNVRYAVNVTSVTLTFGGTTPTYTDTITVGSHVQTTLACTPSTSRPPTTVVWYIGNSVIQNGGEVLKYTFNYDENDQQIRCNVSNIPGGQVITSAKPKLYVQVEVSSVSIKDNIDLDNGATVMVTSGSSKTLTCVPSPCRPAATVTWYIGGVQRTSSITSYNFTFIPTDDDQNKQIYCTASNLQTTVTSKKPVLYVRVNAGIPTLLNSTTGSQALFVNDEVSLVCVTTLTRPAAIVTWRGINVSRVTDVPTPIGRDLVQVTSTITYVPTKSDNSRNIMCETKIDGQITAAVVQQQLEIWWPPSKPNIISVSPSFPWKEGIDSRSLMCYTTDDGNPKATVSWNSSLGTPDPSDVYKLIFNNVTYEHDGANVSCLLSNGYTVRKGNPLMADITNLDINFSPKVLTNDSRFLAAVSGSVNFSVSSYSKPKDLDSVNVTCLSKTDSRSPFSVSWKLNTVSTPTHGRVDGNIIYLQITNVSGYDYGNYTLVLSNSAGISVWPFSFISYGKPHPVTHFRHINNVNGFPIFYMEGGFNGGDIQEFIIELSTDGGLNWKVKQRFLENNTDYKLPNGSYHFSISGLDPGTYKGRVLSSNTHGTSGESEYVVFTIENPGQDSMCSCTQTTAIIGGVVSNIVTCVLTAIITILIARCYFSPAKDESHIYEGVKTKENVVNLYDCLQEEIRERPNEYINYELTNS